MLAKKVTPMNNVMMETMFLMKDSNKVKGINSLLYQQSSVMSKEFSGTMS